jgi:hypothetical protein
LSASHVIVWDLDGTLGRFDSLNGLGDSPNPVTIQVRPHLREALEGLIELGFRHVLLTLATPLYAELVLHALGVRQLFDRVEGQGQRGKGDAAGLGTELCIGEEERPHRMLFIGDHPHNDEPRDPRVLFHLEMYGLERSARDLVSLARVLLDLGKGSLLKGFHEIARRRPWWARLWPGRVPLRPNRPERRLVTGLGPLLLMRRSQDCPVIAFARPPEPAVATEQLSFIPVDFAERVRAGLQRASSINP